MTKIMSEIATLKIAVHEVKKDLYKYAGYGPHQWDNRDERIVIKHNLGANLLLALKLFKSNYPEDTLKRFESETQDFSKWIDHMKFLSESDDPFLSGSIITMIKKFVAFFEALLESKI